MKKKLLFFFAVTLSLTMSFWIEGATATLSPASSLSSITSFLPFKDQPHVQLALAATGLLAFGAAYGYSSEVKKTVNHMVIPAVTAGVTYKYAADGFLGRRGNTGLVGFATYLVVNACYARWGSGSLSKQVDDMEYRIIDLVIKQQTMDSEVNSLKSSVSSHRVSINRLNQTIEILQTNGASQSAGQGMLRGNTISTDIAFGSNSISTTGVPLAPSRLSSLGQLFVGLLSW